MNRHQQEANKILQELQQDLNEILSEDSQDSKCQQLLYQELGEGTWKGRYFGTYRGKEGHFQFVLDLNEDKLTVGEEVPEKA